MESDQSSAGIHYVKGQLTSQSSDSTTGFDREYIFEVTLYVWKK